MFPNSKGAINNSVYVFNRGSSRGAKMLQQSLQGGSNNASAPTNKPVRIASLTRKGAPTETELVSSSDGHLDGVSENRSANFLSSSAQSRPQCIEGSSFYGSSYSASAALTETSVASSSLPPTESAAVGLADAAPSVPAAASLTAANSSLAAPRHSTHATTAVGTGAASHSWSANGLTWEAFSGQIPSDAKLTQSVTDMVAVAAPLSSRSQPNNNSTVLAQLSTVQNGRSASRSSAAATAAVPLSTGKCFSLVDGRPTSLVTTPDGKFCLVAFSSGYIRLFDLSLDQDDNAVGDADDRFGHRMGTVGSSATNMKGSLSVLLNVGGDAQLQSAQQSSNSARLQDKVCHVFAGTAMGSSTMLVVDMVSLRDLKAQRGFITMAGGGGVQVFSHNDKRLKGFISLTTVRVQTGVPSGGALQDGEYIAEYRLATGRGMATYHIWGVILTARHSNVGVLEYSQSWQVLYSGQVNGPQMMFCSLAVLRGLPEDVSGQRDAAGCASASSLLPLSILCQAADKDIRTLHLFPASAHTAEVAAPAAGDRPAVERVVQLAPTMQALSKPSPLRCCTNTRAACRDGTMLFAGLDELVVVTLSIAVTGKNAAQGVPHTLSIPATDDEASNMTVPTSVSASRLGVTAALQRTHHFSLLCNSESGAGASSRHLRQIVQVSCVLDGSYALILCSDNSLLLYSATDILGKGSSSYRSQSHGPLIGSAFPSFVDDCKGCMVISEPVAADDTEEEQSGYLTMICQAEDVYKLEVNLAYSWNDHQGEEISNGGPTSESQLLISITWRHINDLSLAAVLSMVTIPLTAAALPHAHASPPDSTTGSLVDLVVQQLPPLMCVGDKGLLSQRATDSGGSLGGSSSGSGRGHNQACCVCGDPTQMHWAPLSETRTGVQSARVTATAHIEESDTSETEEEADSDAGDDEEDHDLGREESERSKKSSPVQKVVTAAVAAKVSVPKKNPAGAGVTGRKRKVGKCQAEEDELLYDPNAPLSRVEREELHNRKQEIALLKNTIRRLQTSGAIAQLKAEHEIETSALKSEAANLMRRFDHRINIERQFRRKVKEDEEKYLARIEELQKKLQRKEFNTGESTAYWERMSRALHNLADEATRHANGEQPNLGLTGSSKGGSNSENVHIASSGAGAAPSSTFSSFMTHSPARGALSASVASFCVVCQEYSANVLLNPCGHVCLCENHAEQMKDDRKLRAECPLCKAQCQGYIKLQLVS